MNKKAIEFTITQLVTIILVIIFLIWMLFFYSDIKDALYQKIAEFWEMIG